MNIKKLVSGIFFKLFIGLLILSFAFFGISSFLLGNSNSWVAKVDGKKISYNQLQNAMKNDRETILQNSNNNPKAVEYVESAQFMSDVLSRIVNKEIVKKLSENFGADASRKLILEAIARDPQFKYNGKFDRQIFQNFLAQNGFDEDTYVRAVQDEIVATMIVNSLSAISPVDEKTVEKLGAMKNETRQADVVVVSQQNIDTVAPANEAQLQTIYEKNKEKFSIPEFRQASYITIKKQDLAQKPIISEKEIIAQYEANKESYKESDRRDFYHIIFDEEKKADAFLKKLDENNNKNFTENFIKTAKSLENKSEKSLLLQNMRQEDLLPEIGNVAFKLKQNQYSPVLASPLGFHILLLKEVKKGDYAPLAKVRESIVKQLASKKEENLFQDKISEIENLLASSSSLNEVVSKLKIGQIKTLPAIDAKGLDQKGSAISEAKLENFVQNVFATKLSKTSSLHFVKDQNIFYAIKLDKLEKAKERSFAETKPTLEFIYQKEQKAIKLKEFANKIAEEIRQNPANFAQVAAKNKLRVIANKTFPRSYTFKFQGQEIPYANSFLEELFDIKIGQTTSPFAANENEFNIGILRKINTASITKNDITLQKQELANTYRREILEIFNNFLQRKYPIKVNEEFLKQISDDKNNGA